MKNSRIESFDLLRGLAIVLIILFHSSVYNFANIHRVDFSNPPVIVVLISFMALWGGVFIIYSTVLNCIMLSSATSRTMSLRPFYFLIMAGLIYLVIHFFLNLFLGRWNIDFVNNMPVMTATASLFRTGRLNIPLATKLFDGSSVGTVGMNLIIFSLIICLSFRKRGIEYTNRYLIIAGIIGILIMLLSFVRVYLFHFYNDIVEARKFMPGILLSFFFANPYPLLPYTAYGIFGTMIGLMIYQKRNRLLKRSMIPTGLFFLVYGIAGMMKFEKTISKPDFFWYFKTNFELGIFILLIVFSSFTPSPGSNIFKKLTVIRWFSRVSLTIYLLETTLSEALRIPALKIVPGWDQTINGCLAFGAVNILCWALILFFWRKVNFRYSLEYFWVGFFNKLGKASTKLESV